MPRGIPKPKPAATPAPMILVQPDADGSIGFNAYGLEAGEIIDTLRRSLLHLVATQAGVQVISLEVPPLAAVVLPKPSAAKTKPAKASRRRVFDEDYYEDDAAVDHAN